MRVFMFDPSDADSPKRLTPEERASAFQHREAAHQTLVSLGFLETSEISGVEGEPEQSEDTSEVKRATWPPIWPSWASRHGASTVLHFLLILFGLKGDVRTVLASRCPLPIHRKVANGTKVAKGTNGETFAPFESFASFRSFMHTGSGIYIHRYEHLTHSTIKIFLLLVFSFQLRLYFDISLKKETWYILTRGCFC